MSGGEMNKHPPITLAEAIDLTQSYAACHPNPEVRAVLVLREYALATRAMDVDEWEELYTLRRRQIDSGEDAWKDRAITERVHRVAAEQAVAAFDNGATRVVRHGETWVKTVARKGDSFVNIAYVVPVSQTTGPDTYRPPLREDEARESVARGTKLTDDLANLHRMYTDDDMPDGEPGQTGGVARYVRDLHDDVTERLQSKEHSVCAAGREILAGVRWRLGAILSASSVQPGHASGTENR